MNDLNKEFYGETGEMIARITKAVRAADEEFKTVGGSTRHWVRECLLSCLQAEGLRIVDTKLLRNEKRRWGTFKCKCGRHVLITSEVVKVGEGVQTIFEGLCICGNKSSSWFPENVQKDLLEHYKE